MRPRWVLCLALWASTSGCVYDVTLARVPASTFGLAEDGNTNDASLEDSEVKDGEHLDDAGRRGSSDGRP